MKLPTGKFVRASERASGAATPLKGDVAQVMDQSAEDIKEHLMRISDEFRHLSDQHRSLKKQVAQLEGKPFLTEQEELEEQRLKKLKLHIKDQMETMINEYRPQSVTSAV